MFSLLTRLAIVRRLLLLALSFGQEILRTLTLGAGRQQLLSALGLADGLPIVALRHVLLGDR